MRTNPSFYRVYCLFAPSALRLVSLLLSVFALLPGVEAVSPAPDGEYPGGNTAEGQNALLSLTTGSFNTAVGFLSLKSETTDSFNTAVGAGTLFNNAAGYNTATGAGALLNNGFGGQNTANGAFALFSNRSGSDNTAVGSSALLNNTAGYYNTAVGAFAMSGNDSGAFNTALGMYAGSALSTASNVICIGANVSGDDVSNTCFIGNIRDVQTQNADAIPVVVDHAGQLGTASSSRRFKKEIKPMAKASEAILALEPVTFCYKSDKSSKRQFGLIAEEVAKVNPDLVVHDKNGNIYTVRYDAVNAMLLNEFLKEHSTVRELKKEVAVLTARLKEQDLKLEKVNARLETSRSAPQLVGNRD